MSEAPSTRVINRSIKGAELHTGGTDYTLHFRIPGKPRPCLMHSSHYSCTQTHTHTQRCLRMRIIIYSGAKAMIYLRYLLLYLLFMTQFMKQIYTFCELSHLSFSYSRFSLALSISASQLYSYVLMTCAMKNSFPLLDDSLGKNDMHELARKRFMCETLRHQN